MNTTPKQGSFLYIEQKIRDESSVHDLGKSFEWLCKYFLHHSPIYKEALEKVWLWGEWPDRWGIDKGIDLVARTRNGQFWAIQAKAVSQDRSIPKRELDSFLSESNRPLFSYRLVISTTNDIGRNAKETIEAQEKPIGLILRSELLNAEIVWPTLIGSTPSKTSLPSKKSLPHQKVAIRDVLKGFRKYDRGQLIMACGAGKTLAALWIDEELESQRTLLFAPSLSLIEQSIGEWRQNCSKPFDLCVVCSDETVIDKKADAAINSTSELGVPVTTNPEEIRAFLNRNGRRKVVFATYQSSSRIAEAQSESCPSFNLVICDEAHRCSGPVDSLFATVLADDKIISMRRLFMTATPRFYTGRVKKRADELDYELASMDDSNKFGPVFHALNFSEAIDKDLLSDYRVVVIGVTDGEVKAFVDEGKFVQIQKGIHADARALASQIGISKAMRKYGIRKLLTFHSTVAKAKAFSDPKRKNSLARVISTLPSSAKPSGNLWTCPIWGEIPAGIRKNMIDKLRYLEIELPNTRGVMSNCAVLSEGIDVPTVDGVAFIDPKRSMVNIIQAVGRVMRKAEVEKIGTIVIPVFIEETADPDEELSKSAFEPVWAVLRALKAHDNVLADEIDALRVKLGPYGTTSGKTSLPKKIIIDLPSTLDILEFQRAFTVRVAERASTTWDSMILMLKSYKAKFGNLHIRRSATTPWTELGQWSHKIRLLGRAIEANQNRSKRNMLTPERIAQLNSLEFDWMLEGVTLYDTTGLLVEAQFKKASGFTSISKYRKKGLIEPVGYGMSSSKVSAFYHPNQIEELKKKLGIALDDTSGLINETEFIKASGFTKIDKYRKKGLIEPVGYGMSSSKVSAFYHPNQIEELKKKLGIALDDTSGLLNEKQFKKATIRQLADFIDNQNLSLWWVIGGDLRTFSKGHFRNSGRISLMKTRKGTLEPCFPKLQLQGDRESMSGNITIDPTSPFFIT